MLFTLTAASRIANVARTSVRWVRTFWKVVNVCLRGCAPRFVSKRKFYADFVGLRKLGAKAVEIKRIGERHFQALSSQLTEIYDVELLGDVVTCTCKDYERQVETFGKGCCKHGYAALNTLGFSTLADYVAA